MRASSRGMAEECRLYILYEIRPIHSLRLWGKVSVGRISRQSTNGNRRLGLRFLMDLVYVFYFTFQYLVGRDSNQLTNSSHPLRDRASLRHNGTTDDLTMNRRRSRLP